MENYVSLSLEKYQELYSKAKAYDDFISNNTDIFTRELKNISECLDKIANNKESEDK